MLNANLVADLREKVSSCLKHGRPTDQLDLSGSFIAMVDQMSINDAIKKCIDGGISVDEVRAELDPLVKAGRLTIK